MGMKGGLSGKGISRMGEREVSRYWEVKRIEIQLA
jgi:hypothetical protein